MPKVAAFGCGYWGKNLVRNFHALGVLGMVCDPAESGRKTAQEIAPGVPVTASFEDALKDPTIVGVALATPAETHHPLVLAALRAAKHVFVEKPLALNVTQGDEMCRVAKETGRILMVGHLLQYHPYIRKILSMVSSGALGRLQYLTSNRLNLGKIRREENALWSFAPHDLSVILAIAGNQLPEQVRCVGEAWLTPGIADTTLTTLKFSGGLRAHVYVSWLNPFKEQKLTVVGSDGMLVFDDTRPWNEKLLFHRQPVTWTNGQIPTPAKSAGEPVLVPEAEPLREECLHFVQAIQNQSVPLTNGEEGLRVLAVLQAAQSSLERDGDAVRPQLGDAAAAPTYFVHPSAYVDDGAIVGKGTKVWHFSHVMKGAQIGERCVLGQNVNVDGGTRIGNNVKIQNNVSIYTGIEIEDDVFLGPSCVLTNVSNPRSQVNRHKLYEKTLIRRGASVGANATIVCGTTIGRYALIAAGSVVTKDVPDYALMMGNPARQKGWMSRHGHHLTFGTDGKAVCPESGLCYSLTGPDHVSCDLLDEESPLPAALTIGHKSFRQFRGDNSSRV